MKNQWAPQFGNQILSDAVEKEFHLGIVAEIWKGSTPSAPVARFCRDFCQVGAARPFRQDTVDAQRP